MNIGVLTINSEKNYTNEKKITKYKQRKPIFEQKNISHVAYHVVGGVYCFMVFVSQFQKYHKTVYF